MKLINSYNRIAVNDLTDDGFYVNGLAYLVEEYFYNNFDIMLDCEWYSDYVYLFGDLQSIGSRLTYLEIPYKSNKRLGFILVEINYIYSLIPDWEKIVAQRIREGGLILQQLKVIEKEWNVIDTYFDFIHMDIYVGHFREKKEYKYYGIVQDGDIIKLKILKDALTEKGFTCEIVSGGRLDFWV